MNHSEEPARLRDLSDEKLVGSTYEAGIKLWKCAMEQHATLGSITDDSRWSSPYHCDSSCSWPLFPSEPLTRMTLPRLCFAIARRNRPSVRSGIRWSRLP